LAPELWDRLQTGKRETPIAGAALPNFFRKPYGPGWLLVGDAGYNKDPITAQGISDAFLDVERFANALDKVFGASDDFAYPMEVCRIERDTHSIPMYEFTCQLATLQPPPPEMQQLFGAVCGDAEAMNRFVQMNAGTISPAEFLAPDSINKIM